MNSELDRPLGVKPDHGTKSSIKILLIIGAFTGFVVAGFIVAHFLTRTDSPTMPQISASTPVKQKQPEELSKIPQRPDLPIEDEPGGLRELTADGDLNLPKIVPQRRPQNVRQKQILAYIPDGELIEKSKFGMLPRRSPDGLRPMDVYSRQAETEGNFGVARIVIIVGGLGISQSSTQQAIDNLPGSVTFAFAPYGNSLTRWMQRARRKGHELLMQIPMEPFGYPQITAGKHALLTSASKKETTDELHWNLGRITNYVGVMNHLGGKLMTTPDKLKPVLAEITERGLLFVDNGSVRNSAAGETAKILGLPFASTHITIDNIRTRQNIRKRLQELETMAKRTGLAIGVATAFPDSISAISQFLRNAKARGLELTPVSAIVSKPR